MGNSRSGLALSFEWGSGDGIMDETPMPVIYEIDENAGLIRTRCVGELSFSEVTDHFRVLESDPRCRESLDVLLDLSGLTSLPTPDQLRAISAELGWIRPKVQFRCCAVVAPQEVLFGLSRMFEVVAAERFRRTRVFRRVDEAEDWLRSRPAPAS